MIPDNPHIKYKGDRRGYFKATVTPERMTVDLHFVTSVEDTNGIGYAEGSWVGKGWRSRRCSRLEPDGCSRWVAISHRHPDACSNAC